MCDVACGLGRQVAELADGEKAGLVARVAVTERKRLDAGLGDTDAKGGNLDVRDLVAGGLRLQTPDGGLGQLGAHA
ncbi:MAG: hypothetical protein WBG92_02215, partial [Thiohalocapsa sp.]